MEVATERHTKTRQACPHLCVFLQVEIIRWFHHVGQKPLNRALNPPMREFTIKHEKCILWLCLVITRTSQYQDWKINLLFRGFILKGCSAGRSLNREENTRREHERGSRHKDVRGSSRHMSFSKWCRLVFSLPLLSSSCNSVRNCKSCKVYKTTSSSSSRQM